MNTAAILSTFSPDSVATYKIEIKEKEIITQYINFANNNSSENHNLTDNLYHYLYKRKLA